MGKSQRIVLEQAGFSDNFEDNKYVTTLVTIVTSVLQIYC